MNAMSVSPVKPPLNSGNLTVSPSATNLTKSAPTPPIPTNNSYNPINLVPEAKPTVPFNSNPATLEKSIELCSKPSASPVPVAVPAPAVPTSNGSVSPVVNKSLEISVAPAQNCIGSRDVAENLTISASTKIESAPPEIKVTPAPPVEKKEPPKATPALEKAENVTSEVKVAAIERAEKIDKGNIAQNAISNEIFVKTDSVPKKEEEKKRPEEVTKGEPVGRKATVSPTKPEPVPQAPEVKAVPAVVSNETKEEKVDEKPDPKPKHVTAVEAPVAAATTTEEGSKRTPPRATKRKAKAPFETAAEEDNADGRRSKRTRLPTQPYQSPTPELQKIIANLNTPAKTTPKVTTDKITAFYKNEFLAVRNPEGSFYICQTFQNIYRGSSKIKIRWYTNLPNNIYTPDFCDTTEFDCIITNVTMTRVEKDRWKLPDHEQNRIENILKRALDVEKGVAEQVSFTEEHPDGLDLSLYKDEAQLQKKKKKQSPKKEGEATVSPKKKMRTARRKAKAEKLPAATAAAVIKKSPRVSTYLSRDSTEVKPTKSHGGDKVGKKEKKKKKGRGGKKQVIKQNDKVSSKTWEPSVKASNSSKVVLSLKKEDAAAKSSTSEVKTPTKRMSSVSQKASAAAAALPLPAPAKRRKEEPKPSPNQMTLSERPGKIRNAGSAVAAKISSAAMRTTKEKERKSPATNQRKK